MVYTPENRASQRAASSPDAPLRPELALLTPAWLAALTALIVNDHLLKGAELLPTTMTGKLSDFAGMLVAPALLATLVRARGRRALITCHVAVGAVFAAINVSPAAADLWSSLMGAIAVPWAITVDPSDLLALPFLGLSWILFAPVMARQPGAPTRRLVESTAAGLGVVACVATSPDEPIDPTWGGTDTDWTSEESYTPITADVYIHNASESEDLVVRVRELDPAIGASCAALAEDPGALITDGLLGVATTWTLPPSTNAAVRPNTNTSADCYAALVDIDAMPPALLFWQRGEIAVTQVEGLIRDRADHLPGAVIVDRTQPGFAAYSAETPSILYPVPTEESEFAQSPSCAPLDDGNRLAWTSSPSMTKRVTHVDQGLDGCVALRLDDGEGELPSNPEDAPVDWYLCIPPSVTFPFAAGDDISVAQTNGFGSNPTVELTLLPDVENPLHTHAITMTLGTGDRAPLVSGTVLEFQDAAACGPVASATCGTVVHRGELSARFLDGQTYVLSAGTSATLGDDDENVEVHLAHAERRLAYHPDCALGPDQLGPDLEVVAIHREALP